MHARRCTCYVRKKKQTLLLNMTFLFNFLRVQQQFFNACERLVIFAAQKEDARIPT